MSSLPRTTPLDDFNRRHGGRMIDFAGWELPVQFNGTLAEHKAAREHAALFDVSHMQQIFLRGAGAAAALEALVPADIKGLKLGRQRYTMFLNEAGGIIDDIMVSVWPEGLFLIVNAARASVDIAHLRAKLPGAGQDVTIEIIEDRALLALQGPQAEAILASLAVEVSELPFMGVTSVIIGGAECWVSRSGYTGEDGFEISIPAAAAPGIAQQLVDLGAVPAGLAARDTLRLEAGLCLYGQEIDETTTPCEAELLWTIQKRRREALDFPGGAVIGAQIANGCTRIRVGIAPSTRAPARGGAEIFAANGALIGRVTSGSFGASLGGPMAMGYVATAFASPGTELFLSVRGQKIAAVVTKLPFIAHQFKR